MMRKTVIVEAKKPLAIVDCELPAPPPQGAIIKTAFAGVCHSDVHLVDGHFHANQSENPYIGVTPGHEISGVVVSFGSAADPVSLGLKIGDRVCVFPWIACQKCACCRIGQGSFCVNNANALGDLGLGPKGGGFGSHVTVPECRFLVKVPGAMSLRTACMLPCSGITSYAALLKAKPFIEFRQKIEEETRLLIIGAGGLGQWAMKLATKGVFKGLNVKVTIADIDAKKIEEIKKDTSIEGYHWNKEAAVEEVVSDLTEKGQRRFDAVINFVGNAVTSEVSVRILNLGGVCVLVGLYGGTMSIMSRLMVASSLTLTGSRTGTLQELQALVDLVGREGIMPDNVKEFPLDDVNEVIDLLRAGKIAGRGVLKLE